MTPRRRDRFYSSLRQLEQRLASESSPIKKGRLAHYKEFADTEPNANTSPKCGLADANTMIDNDEPVVVNGSRLADANAIAKYGLADASDALKCGLAGANATLRCVLADGNATSNCGFADVLASSSCDANAVQTGTNLISDSGLAGANATVRCGLNVTLRCGLNATSIGGSADIPASPNCGSSGATSISTNATSSFEFTNVHLTPTCTPIDVHEGRTKNDYDIVHRGDAVASTGDSVHIVNVDYVAHDGRESLDLITLCEDEEEMYDAIFSGDNEDSGSLLELSARWNPWELGRHTGEFDSHPPVEFLSTPMINNTINMIDRKTPESSARSLCHDLQEPEEDDLQDLTRLCALLGLDEHAWLPEVKEASLALQTNKLSDDSERDFTALHHGHPSSTFYCNVAKVGEKSLQCAKALDFWLQRLWQLQTEPYCRALLLMAKASLQKDKGISEGFSLEFPSIIQGWLALQSVADQHELI